MSVSRWRSPNQGHIPMLFGCVLVALLFLGATAPSLYAQGFARVGPVGFGGFPAWYQDKTGLAMEFCSPTNTAELNGGWCLLLPTTGVSAPETFPTPFSNEHFYWSGTADLSTQMPNGGKALLVLSLEGAFATNAVIPGEQIVFGRIRIVVNPLPASGTYTVYTPFGKYVFPNQVQGQKLFFTEDIGLQCAPGDFTCALQAKVGPFLLPSLTPGGAELPPVDAATPNLLTAYPGTGKKYIADPARIGPATGSPLAPFVSAVDGLTYDSNAFRVEGPNGFVMHTNSFALMGRVFEGPIGGQVRVDRASYARSASSTKVDVFATGLPGVQARIPSQPPGGAIAPQLQYYDEPCVANLDADGKFLSWSAPPSATAHQLLGVGSMYWGQSAPPTVPSEVCVMQTNARDANGNTVSAFFPRVVGDQVFIDEASYDPASQTLAVRAHSSDQMVAQTLNVTDFGAMTNGQYSLQGLLAAPSIVRVTSSGLGSEEAHIVTGVGASGPGTTVPVAANDVASLAEDSGATAIAVLANDTIGGGAIPVGSIVTLAARPARGTAAVNVDGTISYTPNANFSGTDSFTYSVAVNGISSNIANVTVTVTPVNDPPVAVNDAFSAVVGVAISLPVLANDLDVDGNLVPGGTAILVTPPAAGATASVNADGTVLFTATVAGTYSFTYRARDAAGALSAGTATATVTVAGSETVTITLAEYRRSQGRLRLAGTVSPVNNPPQRLEVRWANGSNTVSVVATPVADGAGNWVVDIRGATGIQNPDNSGATQVNVRSPGGGSRTIAIAFR